jgi:DNA-binding protein H-NS
MKNVNPQSMSTDELRELYEVVIAELARKITAKRDELEDRLRRLGANDREMKRDRRPYPKVFPKYRNPKNRNETWAGRGRQPRWLAAQLRTGKALSDFLIR